jgi:hypothetical protein
MRIEDNPAEQDRYGNNAQGMAMEKSFVRLFHTNSMNIAGCG